MEAFSQALAAEDSLETESIDAPDSPLVSPGSRSLSRTASIRQIGRIRKVSAVSDFAPVHVKVKKRRKGQNAHVKRQEWLFLLVRWPLLVRDPGCSTYIAVSDSSIPLFPPDIDICVHKLGVLLLHRDTSMC